MFPGGHGLRLYRLQQPAPGHHPQQSPAHGSLDGHERWFIHSGSRVKGDAAGRGGSKHAIDDDAVEVEMGVEQGTKAVDENHRPEGGRGAGARAALAQLLLDRAQKNVQRRIQHCRLALEVITQALGH